MRSIRNWMLGAAVVAGGLGLGATTAQAAQFGVYVRGPVLCSSMPWPGLLWITDTWPMAIGFRDVGISWAFVVESRFGYFERDWDHEFRDRAGFVRDYDRDRNRTIIAIRYHLRR